MSKMRCPMDARHTVSSWGRSGAGTRRFRCRVCGITFTRRKEHVSKRNRLSWLRRWIRGSTIPAIAQLSRHKPKTIRRAIHWYLSHPPEPNPVPNPECHMVIDGTWFGRGSCFLVYWDHDREHAQRWRYTTGERTFEAWEDLRKLKEQGVIPASVTSDGARGIVNAVSMMYLDIPHQRCITHLQRQCLALITQKPRHQAGREIKGIVQELSQISSHELKGQWLGKFNGWCNRWDGYLGEKTHAKDLPEEERYKAKGRKWWYTHGSLRRVRASIQNAIPDLFHYLDDPAIPKTSNGLEGRFSSLKQHYRQHKGLSEERRGAYLAWYLTVVVNGEKPTRFVH